MGYLLRYSSEGFCLFVLQHSSVLREKSIMGENQYSDKGILCPLPLRIDFMQECLNQLLMIY